MYTSNNAPISRGELPAVHFSLFISHLHIYQVTNHRPKPLGWLWFLYNLQCLGPEWVSYDPVLHWRNDLQESMFNEKVATWKCKIGEFKVLLSLSVSKEMWIGEIWLCDLHLKKIIDNKYKSTNIKSWIPPFHSSNVHVLSSYILCEEIWIDQIWAYHLYFENSIDNKYKETNIKC